MNFEAFIILGVSAFLMVIGYAAYRAVTSEADIIAMNLFGKTYSFKPPFQHTHYFVAAPFIRPVNEFLWAFANSSELRIEFTSVDIRAGSDVTSILQPLLGLDYERIRLRLRVISNLDPVVNTRAEEGLIRFKGGLDPKEYEMRSRFSKYGQSIAIEKI